MRKGDLVRGFALARDHKKIHFKGTIERIYQSTIGGSKLSKVARVLVDRKKSPQYSRANPGRIRTSISLSHLEVA